MTELRKIRIAVVEDEIIIADHLCETLAELGYEALEPAISYTEAMELLLIEKPDFAILDIRLSGSKDGVDVAEKINEKFQIPFIFLTSNSDKSTLERVKKVRPYAYLVKPFTKDELFTSIEIAMSNHEQKISNEKPQENKENKHVFVKYKNHFVKIFFDSILFIKSDHIYIEIFTKTEKIVVRNSLNEFVKLLDDRFLKVHRSFVTNTDFVVAYNGEELTVDIHQIPVSTNHRKDVVVKLGL